MEDLEYMHLALELAKHGEGRVNPNPLVGAVVVKMEKSLEKDIIMNMEDHMQKYLLCKRLEKKQRGNNLCYLRTLFSLWKNSSLC